MPEHEGYAKRCGISVPEDEGSDERAAGLGQVDVLEDEGCNKRCGISIPEDEGSDERAAGLGQIPTEHRCWADDTAAHRAQAFRGSAIPQQGCNNGCDSACTPHPPC